MKRKGFTLIELLIVVAIIAILSAIAVYNFTQAVERARRAADAANLHTIATALQSYLVDYNRLPPADREAGPFESQTATTVQNGPAAGGYWDGLPWLLYDLHYVNDWETLFCPKYLKLYNGGATQRGHYPRYHNFRYAYNSTALSSEVDGQDSNIMSGTVWLVRDLYLPADQGWWADKYPSYPADYKFPWGDNGDVEYALYGGSIRLVQGGTHDSPKDIP